MWGFRILGFRVWGLLYRVCCGVLGFWGLGFGVYYIGFSVGF